MSSYRAREELFSGHEKGQRLAQFKVFNETVVAVAELGATPLSKAYPSRTKLRKLLNGLLTRAQQPAYAGTGLVSGFCNNHCTFRSLSILIVSRQRECGA
jgi:hypothetical protein